LSKIEQHWTINFDSISLAWSPRVKATQWTTRYYVFKWNMSKKWTFQFYKIKWQIVTFKIYEISNSNKLHVFIMQTLWTCKKTYNFKLKNDGKNKWKRWLLLFQISNIKIIKLQKMIIHLPHPRFLHIKPLEGLKMVEIPTS